MKYPIPLLLFSDPSGLTLPRFNTIRLGPGWFRKLERNDRVLLGHKDKVIGHAWVDDVEYGEKDVLLAAHAAQNHIELAMKIAHPGTYDPGNAYGRRLMSMAKNYGARTVDNTKTITVIWLRTKW